MPLVRIDIVQGRSEAEVRTIADTVQAVVLEVFAAPPGDRIQIVTEHPPGRIIVEDSGLGYERTDAITVVQVVQQGRSQQQKTTLYDALARRLDERCGIAPTDLVVSVVENAREDWSFGEGRAQFLDGGLP